MPVDTQHSAVKMRQPKDIKAKIWRYMSLAKLIDFLRTDKLYFARRDTTIDKFEGFGTKANAQIRELQANYFTQKNKWSIDKGKSVVRDINAIKRSLVYMNCWYKSDKESMAMWKIYGETDCRSNTKYL